MVLITSFNYDFNDLLFSFLHSWYKIAVQFDGNQVKYFVDCKLVESRFVSIPDYCFNEGNFSMMVGKNLNGKQQYTGSLQSVRVLSTLTNPLVKQCPDISLEQGVCLNLYMYDVTCCAINKH